MGVTYLCLLFGSSIVRKKAHISVIMVFGGGGVVE
jgi:hypothetical protein